jgi:hypothetical protein
MVSSLLLQRVVLVVYGWVREWQEVVWKVGVFVLE